MAKKNVSFDINHQLPIFSDEELYTQVFEPMLLVGDARDLSFLQNNSIDLICAHPPYANIVHYTDYKTGDLSFFDVDDFLREMSKVAKESFRVLKPGRQCAILIGDTRRKKHVVPLGFKLINVYSNVGFKLRELIIKQQHNCKTTGFWYANSIKYNFLLLAHEYLLIFEKPTASAHSTIKRNETDYRTIIAQFEKPFFGEKLNVLETTTVWILPQKNFEEQLNRNVIDRYSNGKEHLIISFELRDKNENEVEKIKTTEKPRSKKLIFIKSPLLNNTTLTNLAIECYLEEMKKFVEESIHTIDKYGFLVIQTRDVRINGYIEPIAKMIVDIFEHHNNLWLKEVVVVTQEGSNMLTQEVGEYLNIVHQYLLVFEVK